MAVQGCEPAVHGKKLSTGTGWGSGRFPSPVYLPRVTRRCLLRRSIKKNSQGRSKGKKHLAPENTAAVEYKSDKSISWSAVLTGFSAEQTHTITSSIIDSIQTATATMRFDIASIAADMTNPVIAVSNFG